MTNEPDMWFHVLRAVAAITAILIMFETLRRVVVAPIVRGVRLILEVVEQLKGRPEHDGFPRTPGIMEMMTTVRHDQETMKAQQRVVIAEQKAIKTKVDRLEYHTGNGQEPALREIVIQQTADTADIKARLHALESEQDTTLRRSRQRKARVSGADPQDQQ